MVRPLVTTMTSSRSARSSSASATRRSWCRRRARRTRPTRTSAAAATPMARLASVPRPRSPSNGARRADRSAGIAPPCTRDRPPGDRGASRSVRMVTSDAELARRASATRTKPRASTTATMRSRRRGAARCRPQGAGRRSRSTAQFRILSITFATANRVPTACDQKRRMPIVKRATALADGRELIYFDDADTTLSRRARASTPAHARPAARHRDHAAGRADRRMGLDRRRPAEPGVPAARPSATRSRRAATRTRPRSRRLRRRRVREPLAVVRAAARRADDAPRGLDDLADVGLGRTRTSRRPLRGRLLQPRDRTARSRSSRESRARTVIEAWADRTAALVGAARRRAGVPVREPRRGDRRHPAPPARPDLRLPLRHAAHARGCCDASTVRARPVRRHPRDSSAPAPRVVLAGEHWTAFVPFAARWPIEVHLLPHRHVPDFAGLTERRTRRARRRSTCGCCAASTRSTTPRRPTSRPGIRRRCTSGATPCG